MARQQAIVAVAVGALAFLVYVFTLHAGVPGGDAGELIAVAATGGVAHPPGYPLYSMLAQPFTWLPWGNVAWRVNLFSALCGAAAAALLAWVVARATREPWAGFASGGLFAFAPLPWTYAVGAEVFSLHCLFVTGLLALALLWAEQPRREVAVALALVIGLGLSHHHTLVLLAAPLAAWVAWSGRRRWRPRDVAALVAAFAIGLLPYAYLPLAAAADPVIYWGDFSTVAGFVAHLTRADYGSLQLGADAVGVEGIFLTQLGQYAASLARNSLWLGVAVMAYGLYRGTRSQPRFTAALAACFVVYLVVFHALANLPVQEPLFREVTSRFWHQPHLVAFVWLGFGIAAALPRLRRLHRLAGAVVAVGLVLLQLGLHFGRHDQSGNDHVGIYGRAILEALPADAVLLTRGDVITNTVRYAQVGEGLRRDVIVLDQEMLTKRWYVAGESRRHPDIVFPGALYHPGEPGGFTMAAFLEANRGRRPVFVYPEFKPGDASVAGYELWPEGFASRIVARGEAPDFSAWRQQADAGWQRLQAQEWPDWQRFGPETWERVVLLDSWEARHRMGLRALTWAMANGDPREPLEFAAEALGEVTAGHPQPPPHAWKNLGIARARLQAYDPRNAEAMVAAWRRYLAEGPSDDPDRAAIAAAVAAAPPGAGLP
jgi:hypothetical protein